MQQSLETASQERNNVPLKKGTNKAKVSANIAELLHSYKHGGKFAKGKSSGKARSMAVAAAFDLKRKSKKG
jgi:hypothetical protein